MAVFAKLLEEARQRTSAPLPAADVHPHFAACPACREEFEVLAELDRQLIGQLKTMPPAASAANADCPAADVWREIGAGLIDPKRELAHIEHASRCNDCGSRLRA